MNVLNDLRGLLWDVQFADRHLTQEETFLVVQELMRVQDELSALKKEKGYRYAE